jgi:hypothetical protein
MGKEPIPQNAENIAADGDLEAADDLAEIDPAEFFDPEEFGFRRSIRPITNRPSL